MFTHAICRRPGENFDLGLTTADLGRPDYGLILEQHAAYVATLRSLGLEVTILEPDQRYPDGYFVEDPAIVTPEVAVISNPGAPSRRGEQDALADVLATHRKLVRLEPPATLDGGDVLIVDKHVIVGISERTNEQGALCLGEVLQPRGYTLDTVPVGAGLHFKSSVNHVGGETLILTRDFADAPVLQRYQKVVLDESDAYAANSVWINGSLLTPRGFAGAREKLSGLPVDLIEMDTSEIRKMDGGLTCLSLRF